MKIGFFRKGERREVQVNLEEHEAVSEPRDVLKWIGDPKSWKEQSPEKWQERLHILREKSGTLRDRLKGAADKLPGVVVDKQAFVLGIDGTVKKLQGELQNVEEIMKTMREQLEKANIPVERIEEVRKAVEGVIEKTGDAALKAAAEAIREYREARERENNTLEAPKADPNAQPATPAPPIKAPL